MKKILVIEDNDEIRENLCEILTLNGYEVVSAENGQIGVKTAISTQPDLIVCDVMMPTLDGYGVLKILSQQDDLKNIPFLFLTAKDQQDDFRKGMRLGADDYITKPFTGLTVLEAIETRLEKYEALQPSQDIDRNLNEIISKNDIKIAIETLTTDRDLVYFDKNEVVLNDGSKSKWIYYVKSGRLLTNIMSTNAKEYTSKISGPNEFIGYLSAISGLPQSGDVVADKTSELIKIPYQEFLTTITSNNALSAYFLSLTSTALINSHENHANLLYASVRQKVAWSLLHIAPHTDDDQIHMTKKEIAKLSGTTPESVFRALSDFQDEQMIKVTDGVISIVSKAKLESLIY